jgi:hypothetical protein
VNRPRVPGWETALAAYLERVRARPHAYGRHDCMLFVAGAVKAVTGRDFGRRHRGRYAGAAEAARYLKGLGFASPEAMIDSLLEEKPVGFAQRGDVVLVSGVPGVCVGDSALFVGMVEDEARDGLVSKPRAEWARAWRVGA